MEFVIPVIIWTYFASVVLARSLWATFYDKLMRAFDLSPNQAWFFPIIINLSVAALGIPQIVRFIATISREGKVTESGRIAGALCISAIALAFFASIEGAIVTRGHLVSGAQELVGNANKDIYDAGKVTGDIYSNDRIGVSIQLPKEWHLISLNAIRREKLSGSYTATGNNTQQAEALAAERMGHYTLFAVHRYPDDIPGYNPSLLLTAWDKKTIAGLGITNLDGFSEQFPKNEPYHVIFGPQVTHIGTNVGFHVHIEGRFAKGTVQQHLYVTETGKYYISLTASVMDDEDLVSMRHAIQTLHLLE